MQYLIVKDVNHYEQLGTTIDDALEKHLIKQQRC